MPDEKLHIIHKNTDLPIEYDKFHALYKRATNEKYNFFYIDTDQDQFRKNFSHVIE